MAVTRRHPLGTVLFSLLALVSAATLLISCLAQYLSPVEHPLILFFGLYYVPIVLLNLLMLLLALLFFRRALLIPVLALAPTLLLADRFVRFGRGTEIPDGRHVQVMTYNVGRYANGSRKITETESAAGILHFIEQQDADIVCLQEFAVRDTASLAAYLPAYPYRAQHLFKGNRFFGNVTLSKYPIRNRETVTFPQSRNLSLITDVDVDGQVLRVYNCHLESYSISFAAVLRRLFRRDHFTDEMAQVHGRVREATRRRSEQVAVLLQSEAVSPYPSLVCGDFNDTPVSYTYHRLNKTKKDSFVEAGSGFSSTYAALWPMLRIDYILLPQAWTAFRHEISRVPWSDHYPVTAGICLEHTTMQSN